MSLSDSLRSRQLALALIGFQWFSSSELLGRLGPLRPLSRHVLMWCFPFIEATLDRNCVFFLNYPGGYHRSSNIRSFRRETLRAYIPPTSLRDVSPTGPAPGARPSVPSGAGGSDSGSESEDEKAPVRLSTGTDGE